MQEYKITIPIELVNASKIDFTKPVYLCWISDDLLSLSNKKRRNYCFGQIFVDKEYTFTLTQNTIYATLKSSSYKMYVNFGNIYITSSGTWRNNQKISERFTIPKEILQICGINFEKPVYLCFDQANESYYLSNRQNMSYSLGRISFDENYSFCLTDNMCNTLRISSVEQLSVYVSNKQIYFHICKSY